MCVCVCVCALGLVASEDVQCSNFSLIKEMLNKILTNFSVKLFSSLQFETGGGVGGWVNKIVVELFSSVQNGCVGVG